MKVMQRGIMRFHLGKMAEAFPDPDYPLPRTEIRWAKNAVFTLDSKHGNWFIYYLIFSKSHL